MALWTWAGRKIGALAGGGTVGGGSGTGHVSPMTSAAGVSVVIENINVEAHGVENIDELADRILVALQRKLRYQPDLGLY